MLKDRVQARLEALGISQFEAAERVGRDKYFIYDFLIGKKASFKGDGPAKVARALECSIDYLSGTTDEVGTPPVSGDIPVAPIKFLAYGGPIEDGVYRQSGVSLEKLPVSVDPLDGVPLKDQIVFLMRGNAYAASHGIRDGAAVKCLVPSAAGSAMRSGSWVVVRRHQRGMVEVALRELQYFPDRIDFLCLTTGAVSQSISPSDLGSAVEIIGVARAVEFRCP